MLWIAKDDGAPRHAVASARTRVAVEGVIRWKAKTACGRVIVGRSGGTGDDPDCGSCRRVMRSKRW